MSPTADSTIFPGKSHLPPPVGTSQLLTQNNLADYGRVGINFGFTTSGFSEGDEDGLLVWNNTDMGNIGSYFALCPTVIPGFEAAGIQQQVFWQSNEAPEFGTANCSTFTFDGAYEGVQTH